MYQGITYAHTYTHSVVSFTWMWNSFSKNIKTRDANLYASIWIVIVHFFNFCPREINNTKHNHSNNVKYILFKIINGDR